MLHIIEKVIGKHPKIFARFLLVGCMNTGVDFAAFLCGFYIFHWPLMVSHVTAFLIATTNSYFLNKFWTFGDGRKPANLTQYFTFIFVTLLGLGLSSAVIYSASFYMHVIAAKILAIMASLLWNYTGMRLIVFRDRL